jgi:hypothetical protein
MPKPGEIYRGRDFDGITAWEVLVLQVSPDDTIFYAICFENDVDLNILTASLSTFISLYSRTPREFPCPQPKASFFKTFWQGLRRFFSAAGPR